MKKLFVVLEQGQFCNTSLAMKHRKEFTQSYCDFFRLNWANDRYDLTADIYAENITWSEGRSILYNRVRGQYEYYLFIDDDISFRSNSSQSVSEEIRNFLETYCPLTGTIYGDYFFLKKELFQAIEQDQKDVFCMSGHDLQCQIFKDSFAQLVLPIIYHGSYFSLWYAQYICATLHPDKLMALNRVYITNTQHLKHQDYGLKQHLSDAREKFMKLDRTKGFIHFNKKGGECNWKCYHIKPNPKPIDITLDEFAAVVDINHLDYRTRNETSRLVAKHLNILLHPSKELGEQTVPVHFLVGIAGSQQAKASKQLHQFCMDNYQELRFRGILYPLGILDIHAGIHQLDALLNSDQNQIRYLKEELEREHPVSIEKVILNVYHPAISIPPSQLMEKIRDFIHRHFAQDRLSTFGYKNGLNTRQDEFFTPRPETFLTWKKTNSHQFVQQFLTFIGRELDSDYTMAKRTQTNNYLLTHPITTFLATYLSMVKNRLLELKEFKYLFIRVMKRLLKKYT